MSTGFKTRLGIAAVALTLLTGSAGSALAQSIDPWDSLQQVRSRRVDRAYVLPGTDFSSFKKVMIDPVEVAFDRNWQRDFNRNVRGTSGRVSDADAARILGEVRSGFDQIFNQTLTRAGYKIVKEPGADVLRISAFVVNIRVTAPDVPTAGRTQTVARDAGQATVVLELRDALTNAPLGRAIDSRNIGDNGTLMLSRNRVTNRSDFARTFQRWADVTVRGLDELRSSPPVVAK